MQGKFSCISLEASLWYEDSSLYKRMPPWSLEAPLWYEDSSLYKRMPPWSLRSKYSWIKILLRDHSSPVQYFKPYAVPVYLQLKIYGKMVKLINI
jgi:hypothetical protein